MIKTAGKPIYRVLLDDLRAQIDAGVYKKGELLPSENELCRTYNITRPTVRQALAELTRLGYIIRRHGKGSIVSEPKMGLGILALKGVTAGVGKKKLITRVLEKPVKMGWPTIFFYELSTNEKASQCIYFSRLRYVNEMPTLYEETYITNLNLPRFRLRNLEASLFDILRKFYSVEIKEGEQKIWAIEADKKLGDLLKVKMHKPILHMKRKLKTNMKDLNIYSSLYCNTADYFIHDDF